MPIVSTDIIGECSRRFYAKAGTTVKIISNSGNMAVVEDQEGNRFPVRICLLTDDPAQVSEVPPGAAVIEKPAPVIQRKQKKKEPVSSQPNLFT